MARCTRCVDGKVQLHVISFKGGTRTEETVEISCIYCDGTGEDIGKVFVEDVIAWCLCDSDYTFGSYPGFGEGHCGIEKEHVHCGTCGNISQVG